MSTDKLMTHFDQQEALKQAVLNEENKEIDKLILSGKCQSRSEAKRLLRAAFSKAIKEATR